MIFISHNKNDKPIVEPIAIRLSQIFGQDKVFYDSWSIQPGDGIIDKMDEGLRNCQFFFFFVSKNSLNSNMVKLEWQNALMKANIAGIKFIPIRLDESLLPALLSQTLYIDLFCNGLEACIRQMIDVINGQNTFSPINTSISNLIAYKYWFNNKLIIECHTLYYLEPIPNFAFVTTNKETEISFEAEAGMYRGSFGDFPITNNFKVNSCYMAFPNPIVPKLPQIAMFSSKTNVPIDIISIFHQSSRTHWELVTCKNGVPTR